jgi:hypothetical protein
MQIPEFVAGRRVTRRGVHLSTSWHHDDWMADADYWLDLLVSMNMSWVLALSAGDSLFLSGAAEALLAHGVIPIVRFDYQFPGQWAHAEHVQQLAPLYQQYGAPLVVQFANEPFDDREWKNDVPPYEEAWAVIVQRWNEAANVIINNGGIAGFPDGPCYSENPFVRIGDPDEHWLSGRAVYLGHHYGKGRPVNYPYDDVTRHGTPLTMEEYRAQLDDFADDPDWNEGEAVLALMNEQRAEWADPLLTALDDDTCWRGWEKVQWYALGAFGHSVQMAMTEGGWVPRDRAGSNPIDIRWPYTTPRMVAQKTVAMYNDAPDSMFAVCPWTLMSDGWPYDAWVGWAFSDKYGQEKPVVQALREGNGEHMDIEIIDAEGNPQDWDWLVNKYGPIIITDLAGPGYKVVKLQENADVGVLTRDHGSMEVIFTAGSSKFAAENPDAPAIIIVTVLDADGNPQPGISVPWYWPDAPIRDTCLPPNGLPPEIPVLRFGGPGVTNPSGQIGLAMGEGAYYFPPAIGPHAVWICVPGVATQFIIGLGMKGLTNHFSLWPTFQWVEEEPQECPHDEILTELWGLGMAVLAVFSINESGGDCPWDEIEAELGRMEEAIAAIRALRP